MKDPAFLFYPQDFLVGSMTMTFEDRGKYITILCLMHQQGRLSEETIRFLVGSISDMLRLKFSIDENGLFYNKRLESEIEKRSKFVGSRVNNGKLGGRPKKEKKPNGYPNGKPTENLSEDVNENEILLGDNPIIFKKERKNENFPEWRNDFEIYKKELEENRIRLSNDSAFIKQQEKYNPNIDIVLSIEKACVNYWGTEAGWKKKKQSKTDNIDWRATFVNAIEINKVYKPKYTIEQEQSKQSNTYTPKSRQNDTGQIRFDGQNSTASIRP